ncbi:MAG: hypothetical protein GXW99_12455 [Clostridiales bacterium]|nr:hypothetical protein [Clostridiales bacterium]
MEYLLLFLTDGIMGYFLQGVGYLLGVFASVKRKITFREFVPMAALYGLVAFGIRKINVISFGFHTILIMIAIILLAVLLLKTPTFMTVVGILISSVAILVAEVINMAVLSGIFGYPAMMAILAGDGTIYGEINKAVAGIPTNLILLIIMFITYKLRMKPKKEHGSHGAIGTQVGTKNRDDTGNG